MKLSEVNITNNILNDVFIYFSKYKVKLCAHVEKNTNKYDEFMCTNQ